jgi:sulfur carrier protein ThiS
MAKRVTCQMLGGEAIVLDEVFTVGEVLDELGAEGYVASVNGNPAEPDDELDDYSYVSASPAVKGGV